MTPLRYEDGKGGGKHDVYGRTQLLRRPPFVNLQRKKRTRGKEPPQRAEERLAKAVSPCTSTTNGSSPLVAGWRNAAVKRGNWEGGTKILSKLSVG